MPAPHVHLHHTDGRNPWAELRQYERAKADGTAVEASFGDLLDVINPLQHIPVVSTIYRELTGDALSGHARVVGGTLYGGVGGFIGGLVDAVVTEDGGPDFGARVMAAVGLGDGAAAEESDTPDAPATDVAEAGSGQAEPAPEGTEAAATRRDPKTDPAAPAATPAAAAPSGAEAAAVLGASGPATGLAALRAFARDTAAVQAAAAQPVQTAARPGDPQTAAAPPAGAPAPDRRAPNSFMPLGDRAALIAPAARTAVPAVDRDDNTLGHRRLQGDPRAVPSAAYAAPGTGDPAGTGANDRGQTGAAPAAAQPAPAGGGTATVDRPSAPAATAGSAPAPAGDPGVAPGRGDLAARMMRALDKYEAMHKAR